MKIPQNPKNKAQNYDKYPTKQIAITSCEWSNKIVE